MRLSRFFLPILKETPKEAEIVSHRLMLRAGMMRQEAAGIYAWLPLGLRVLRNIERIVREEQNRAGAIELLMPTLQLADLWRESGLSAILLFLTGGTNAVWKTFTVDRNTLRTDHRFGT